MQISWEVKDKQKIIRERSQLWQNCKKVTAFTHPRLFTFMHISVWGCASVAISVGTSVSPSGYEITQCWSFRAWDLPLLSLPDLLPSECCPLTADHPGHLFLPHEKVRLHCSFWILILCTVWAVQVTTHPVLSEKIRKNVWCPVKGKNSSSLHFYTCHSL